MRWILPGGAVLGGDSYADGERAVACRPLAGVVEASRTVEVRIPEPASVSPLAALAPAGVGDGQPAAVGTVGVGPGDALLPAPDRPRSTAAERLATIKLLLEVLAVLVGLIGAILALIGSSRR